MDFLVFSAGVLAVFLFAVLAFALAIKMIYGDNNALYKLFAVRDELIDVVVFHGVDRNDPWFDAIYRSVNNVLACSHELSGPDNWEKARKWGNMMGWDPSVRSSLVADVDSEIQPPKELVPIASNLVEAIDHLLNNHYGWMNQITAQIKAERKKRKHETRGERILIWKQIKKLLDLQRQTAEQLRLELSNSGKFKLSVA